MNVNARGDLLADNGEIAAGRNEIMDRIYATTGAVNASRAPQTASSFADNMPAKRQPHPRSACVLPVFPCSYCPQTQANRHLHVYKPRDALHATHFLYPGHSRLWTSNCADAPLMGRQSAAPPPAGLASPVVSCTSQIKYAKTGTVIAVPASAPMAESGMPSTFWVIGSTPWRR